MESKELRIGNSVNNRNGISYEVTAEMISEPYGLFPIPLTEEWLVKFGFEKDINREWCKGLLDFQYWDHNNTFHWVSSSGDVDVLIKHVHQLQNLYFALTGKELSHKETQSIDGGSSFLI